MNSKLNVFYFLNAERNILFDKSKTIQNDIMSKMYVHCLKMMTLSKLIVVHIADSITMRKEDSSGLDLLLINLQNPELLLNRYSINKPK